jgi:hypothetical protein
MVGDYLVHEDKIISLFLRSLDAWSQYIVIGGGYAPIIYRLYLSDGIGKLPIATRDIDSLITRHIPEISQKNISKHLLDAGFNQKYRDRNIPATEYYIKNMDGYEVEVEFLTDNATRHQKSKNIFISGVVAVPLNYLEMSLTSFKEFQTSDGTKGLVVSPGAWIFHKGLTFVKRTNASKMYKDLYGIWYVASQLALFSDSANKELICLSNLHPKWFKTFRKNIHNWLETASPMDFLKISTQDPSGKIERLEFERLLREIINI